MAWFRIASPTIPTCLFVCLVLGCEPSSPDPAHARQRFLEMTRNGCSNPSEFSRVFVCAFPIGTLEADHEEILKTANSKVDDPKEVTDFASFAWKGDAKGSTRMNKWAIDDGEDGTVILVFTGGSPRMILGLGTVVCDK